MGRVITIIAILFMIAACQNKQQFMCNESFMVIDESVYVLNDIGNLLYMGLNNEYLIQNQNDYLILKSSGKLEKKGNYNEDYFLRELRDYIRNKYDFIDFFTDSMIMLEVKRGELPYELSMLIPNKNNSYYGLLSVLLPYSREIKDERDSVLFTFRNMSGNSFIVELDKNFKVVKWFEIKDSFEESIRMQNPLDFNNVIDYVPIPESGFNVNNDGLFYFLNGPFASKHYPLFSKYVINDQCVVLLDTSEIIFNNEKYGNKDRRFIRDDFAFKGHTLFDFKTSDHFIIGHLDSFFVQDITKVENKFYFLCFKKKSKIDTNSKVTIFIFDPVNKKKLIKKDVGDFYKIKRGCLHSNGFSIIYENEDENLVLSNYCF
jgi:hypothetical protein